MAKSDPAATAAHPPEKAKTTSEKAKTASVKAKTACVVCGRPRDPRYDPFCSKRCADVDLHRWLKGGYVIPGSEAPREDDEES